MTNPAVDNSELYPLKFHPVYMERIWGGTLMTEVYYLHDAYTSETKFIEHATKKEYIKGAREDWADAYLLEKYFEDIINGKV